jgi:hypothetical protein
MDTSHRIYELTDEQIDALNAPPASNPLAPEALATLCEDVARLNGYLKGRADSDAPLRGKGANKDLAGWTTGGTRMTAMDQIAATTAKAYTQLGNDPAERASIVKEFERAITELQQTVADLADRLEPVLAYPSTPNATPGNDPAPPISEARSRLYDLQGTTAHLRSVLDRLEV